MNKINVIDKFEYANQKVAQMDEYYQNVIRKKIKYIAGAKGWDKREELKYLATKINESVILEMQKQKADMTCNILRRIDKINDSIDEAAISMEISKELDQVVLLNEQAWKIVIESVDKENN